MDPEAKYEPLDITNDDFGVKIFSTIKHENGTDSKYLEVRTKKPWFILFYEPE